MNIAKPLWTWKEETTNRKNGGKRIVLMLAGRDYLTTVWYPPWRNSLERDNATHICQTLNADSPKRAKAKGQAGSASGAGALTPTLLHRPSPFLEVRSMATTKDKTLQKIGKNALDSIRDMIAALKCDYKRLDELRDEKEPDEAEELAELEAAAGGCTDREEAEQRIREDPLSIELRSGWHSIGDWQCAIRNAEMKPEEACILLTTGGPAVRIIVELNEGEPRWAWLEVQDWGTPWTKYSEAGMSDLCLTYASVFCFE